MHTIERTLILCSAALALATASSAAQGRVGSDSATRLTRLGRSAVYGTVEALAYAGVDQIRNDPPEWNRNGYAKRAMSNLGEFYIQEGVTEGLAALMNRPLDYARCACRTFVGRTGNALRGAIFDQMPDGSHELAIPRIVGAYAGSVAQASWRPATPTGRVQTALVNGTTSLAIGFVINMYHEIRR